MKPEPVRTFRRARFWFALAAFFCFVPQAWAVFTYTSATGAYDITLRVGAVSGIDNVVFNVSGTNAGLTPASVGGSQAVNVSVTPTRPSIIAIDTRPVTLTVDSSAGLQCISGGCGSTIIPFNQISWTSSDATNPNEGDIQSGVFSGSSGQVIANFNATNGFLITNTRVMSNNLSFSYANSTVYPAGQYRGRVTFTATML